ncbi:R-mandelonitrile lyase-like protein [Cinnamomum micranthum f. kanehirae]|uniref:R-mandelonitrile lyase-like protein n=1 Tax=Cinnamomum micranthum f. kanehirae TaxID=337451 RepID=A0A3S4PJN9_9MAGN|nr:R-mandelonitrile lyase-like protein [Cinnamomum micranthum f. kanehirae]
MEKFKSFSLSSPPLIFLSFLFLSSLSPISPSGGRRHYNESLFDATLLPNTSTYDFIIVGGGTAGCPLAATLSQHFKVLVLESGRNNQDYPQTATEDGFLQILADASSGVANSPAQSFTSLDGVSNIRGRVLGGGSSVNGGFYSRAQPAFFEAGAAAGIVWDMGLVNASYEWVEKKVVHRPKLDIWQTAVGGALLEANVRPFNGFSVEHLEGTKISGTTFGPDGRRHSAAELLGYAKLTNLVVALRATVEKILLDIHPGGLKKPFAKGVMYRDSLGRPHYAFLRPQGEVILSAGALGSPHLLLLSGIGPPNLLRPWHIPLAVSHPFVGQFLADNPQTGVTIISPFRLPTYLSKLVGISNSSSFYIETSTKNTPLHPQISAASPILNHTIASLFEKVACPVSTGSLWLASADVQDNPVVKFNYFASPVDMGQCIEGMRTMAKVLKSPKLEGFKFPGVFGGKEFRYVGPEMVRDEEDDLQLEGLCRKSLTTFWHYHGGCLVGKVVDSEYRVIGVDSLRVVDGSTFAVSPGTNPQATVMMLGRYVGSQLTKEKWTPNRFAAGKKR